MAKGKEEEKEKLREKEGKFIEEGEKGRKKKRRKEREKRRRKR